MKNLMHTIRTTVTLTLATAWALLLNGCMITSVKPFYFEWDVVEVEHLVGTWHSSDGEQWHLEHDGDAYLWRTIDDDEEILLETTFFEFHGSLFFDFVLHEDAYDENEDLLIFSVRTHSVARAREEGERLVVEFLDYSHSGRRLGVRRKRA